MDSLGVVLFVLSLFNRYLWVVSPILALFPVAAVLPLARKEPLQNVLLFMGKLSAALFVTHAFVRQQVLAHDQALPPEISGLLYLVLCIVVAWVYRLCLTYFYKRFICDNVPFLSPKRLLLSRLSESPLIGKRRVIAKPIDDVPK